MFIDIPNSTNQIIPTESIPEDPQYQGLKIVRYQSSEDQRDKFRQSRYRFQHDTGYTPVPGVLARKGALQFPERVRIIFTCHLNLEEFVNVVQYDPSNPPLTDYHALGMKDLHAKTQSDFKGQKAQNKLDFTNYLIEAVKGQRTPYLPPIAGWQTSKTFTNTVFVAYDESNPNAMYGMMYLPKTPIMQADGQTQTAALFGLSKSADAVQSGALKDFQISLEVELNADERQAGQSFADRNGRGSKKNKNLVIGLDSSSALSELRVQAIQGTVFGRRLATGRNTSTSETATTYIVDLSTMEQMIINVISGGRSKPEHIKHHHVRHFEPYVKEFFTLLSDLFGQDWKESPGQQDPFRRVYVHGWPFALKAIALAYHEVRKDVLGPIANAIYYSNAALPADKEYEEGIELEKQKNKFAPPVTLDDFKDRLEKIDWLRYRKHWIDITGYKSAGGKKRTFKLKDTGEEKVMAQAQNTKYIIQKVKDAILASNWQRLTSHVDEPLS